MQINSDSASVKMTGSVPSKRLTPHCTITKSKAKGYLPLQDILFSSINHSALSYFATRFKPSSTEPNWLGFHQNIFVLPPTDNVLFPFTGLPPKHNGNFQLASLPPNTMFFSHLFGFHQNKWHFPIGCVSSKTQCSFPIYWASTKT